ncbi:hypothetical protein [Bradyrhizobium sp. th.b2]|uniref:hypothetical protein n=1 Tax=Bradyrhizobium sp. th-b2 TaxID=172088 RepID=UPI00049130BC|nr:hypothetical protein [Bradyrhizobium sp. th.b2]
MTESQSRTLVKFLPPEEVGEEQSGWWILHMEPLDNGDMGPMAKTTAGMQPAPMTANTKLNASWKELQVYDDLCKEDFAFDFA